MFAQNVVHNPLHDFLLIFVTAAAFGDLCRSVGHQKGLRFARKWTCYGHFANERLCDTCGYHV